MKPSFWKTNQHAIRSRLKYSSITFLSNDSWIDNELPSGNKTLLMYKLVSSVFPGIVHLISFQIKRIASLLSEMLPHEVKVLAFRFCWGCLSVRANCWCELTPQLIKLSGMVLLLVILWIKVIVWRTLTIASFATIWSFPICCTLCNTITIFGWIISRALTSFLERVTMASRVWSKIGGPVRLIVAACVSCCEISSVTWGNDQDHLHNKCAHISFAHSCCLVIV